MLDEKSIEVISRFKQALANNSIGVIPDSSILESNRGKKLLEHQDDDNLRSKIVEYNGVSYWVTSNNKIDRANQRNKRKWRDYYESTDEYKRAKLEQDKEEQDDIASKTGDDNNDDKVHNKEVEGSDEELEDDDDEEDDEYSYDSNPLQNFDVSEILSAISHPSELVSHPAISKTFKSEVLSKLSKELIELIEIEQYTLNSFNKILQVLNGEDWHYFLEENLGLAKYDHGLVVPEPNSTTSAEEEQSQVTNNASVDTTEVKEELPKRITRTSHTDNDEVVDPFFKVPKVLEKYEELQSSINAQEVEEGTYNAAREDLINHLQVSIQRQQEYIKNLSNIRNHLIRADRLKANLLKWGKEMFDKKSN